MQVYLYVYCTFSEWLVVIAVMLHDRLTHLVMDVGSVEITLRITRGTDLATWKVPGGHCLPGFRMQMHTEMAGI